MSPPERAVRLLRIAEEDLTEIVTYVAADRPSAAERLVSRFERSLRSLARHPHLGRVPNEEALLKLAYRYLVVEDSLVFYTVEPETILVHRIIHGARDYLTLL